MYKDLKEKFGFTLAEGATHVGISHNIGGTFHRFVESFTHVGIFHITRRVAFTLAEGATHVGIFNNTSRVGFTLAEVLITLGIIGIVSAMTIPTLVKNYQKIILTSEFKKAYAMLIEAYRLASTDFGVMPPKCGYWDKNPYVEKGWTSITERNEDGQVIGHKIVKDNEEYPLPKDWNGPANDCQEYGKLILNRLKISKFCNGNALENGCIAKPGYKGKDTLLREQNSEITDSQVNSNVSYNSAFNQNYLNNQTLVYLLQNGTAIINYRFQYFAPDVFVIDINGLKGPNKWGYDLFALKTYYPNNNIYTPVIRELSGHPIEAEGTSATNMINKIRKKQKQ